MKKEKRGALAKSPDLKRLSPGVYRSKDGGLASSKGREYKFSRAQGGGDKLTQAMNTAGQQLQGGGQMTAYDQAVADAAQAAGQGGMAPLPQGATREDLAALVARRATAQNNMAPLPQGMTPEQVAQMVATTPNGARDYASILEQMSQQMGQRPQAGMQVDPGFQIPSNFQTRPNFTQPTREQAQALISGYQTYPQQLNPQQQQQMTVAAQSLMPQGQSPQALGQAAAGQMMNKPVMFDNQAMAAAGFGQSANQGGKYRLSPGVYGTQEQAQRAYMQQMLNKVKG